jgi:hypothetical protein
VDGKLETLLVFIDEALDLEEIVLLKSIEHFLDVIPHFCFELAAAITECEREVRLAGFLRFDLLGYHDERRGNDFIFVANAIADVEIFHGLSEYKAIARPPRLEDAELLMFLLA